MQIMKSNKVVKSKKKVKKIIVQKIFLKMKTNFQFLVQIKKKKDKRTPNLYTQGK